jgi:type I restriction enzyme, S subunit
VIGSPVWPDVALSEAVEFLDGRRRPVKVGDRAKMRGNIPYYGASGIVDYVNAYLFDEDLILLGEDGENILSRVVPLAFKISGKSWVNNHAHVLRPKATFNIDFLTAYLESLDYSGLNSGTAQPKLNKQSCSAIRVVKPPIAEQRRIAATLRDTDDLVTMLERMIAKKQAIKQGVMQQLLTGKTRLPGFTGQWRDVLLGKHVSYVKTVALSRAQLDGESPVRYLHYGDIHTRSSVTLDAAREPMPRASSTLLRNAGRLQVGDLVFADASEDPDGVGKSVEVTSVPDAGVVPGLHTIAARFDKAVLSDGFKAYLQFIPSFRGALLRLAAGTKVLATTRSFISSITLTLPDVDEQRAIASVVADADREIQGLIVRLAKARDVKQGMMQQLLTGRTRLPIKEGAA